MYNFYIWWCPTYTHAHAHAHVAVCVAAAVCVVVCVVCAQTFHVHALWTPPSTRDIRIYISIHMYLYIFVTADDASRIHSRTRKCIHALLCVLQCVLLCVLHTNGALHTYAQYYTYKPWTTLVRGLFDIHTHAHMHMHVYAVTKWHAHTHKCIQTHRILPSLYMKDDDTCALTHTRTRTRTHTLAGFCPPFTWRTISLHTDAREVIHSYMNMWIVYFYIHDFYVGRYVCIYLCIGIVFLSHYTCMCPYLCPSASVSVSASASESICVSAWVCACLCVKRSLLMSHVGSQKRQVCSNMQ